MEHPVGKAKYFQPGVCMIGVGDEEVIMICIFVKVKWSYML